MRALGERIAIALAVVLVLAAAACTLFVDTGGLTSEVDASDGSSEEASFDASVDTHVTDAAASCDETPSSPECIAKEIPTDGIVLWLRADDGVETNAEGRLTVWRDSTPKLRPGSMGSDAKLFDGGGQPLRITEAAGAVVVFGTRDALELPPGFADFSAGLSVFAALWPQLDGNGSAGQLLALGWPPAQDTCARGAEVGVSDFGVDYRAEADAVRASGLFDGRGWDVVSVVHDGWAGANQCPSSGTVKLSHGTDQKKTAQVATLTKATRTGGKLGNSLYYPTEFYNGKLGELLLYNRALDEADASRVAKYLARRWPRP